MQHRAELATDAFDLIVGETRVDHGIFRPIRRQEHLPNLDSVHNARSVVAQEALSHQDQSEHEAELDPQRIGFVSQPLEEMDAQLVVHQQFFPLLFDGNTGLEVAERLLRGTGPSLEGIIRPAEALADLEKDGVELLTLLKGSAGDRATARGGFDLPLLGHRGFRSPCPETSYTPTSWLTSPPATNAIGDGSVQSVKPDDRRRSSNLSPERHAVKNSAKGASKLQEFTDSWRSEIDEVIFRHALASCANGRILGESWGAARSVRLCVDGPPGINLPQGGTAVANYRKFRKTQQYRSTRRGWRNIAFFGVGVVALWFVYPILDPPIQPDRPSSYAARPALTTDRPEVPQAGPVRMDVTEKGADAPRRKVPITKIENPSRRAESLVAAGKDALANGDPIAARTHFSEAMMLGVAEASMLRAELTRLGSESIFSPRIFDNDPFVERYVIKTGDSLAKIATKNKISAELLADINGIRDVNLIRAGRTIKVIRGPFRAIVRKKDFSLDVYLDQTFVQHFRVGLGQDSSTPTGEWRVGTKLKNPTYYPPRGGDIVAADDPRNPLGERWIALIGVSGEAAGQHRYGIHGTNDPESIGQSVSMGCIRMFNEDVEALYTYLVTKHSTVTVVE